MAVNPAILFSMLLISPSSFPLPSACLPCTMLGSGPAGRLGIEGGMSNYRIRLHSYRARYSKIVVRKLLKNILSYGLWFGKVPKDLSVLDKRDEKLFKPATA